MTGLLGLPHQSYTYADASETLPTMSVWGTSIGIPADVMPKSAPYGSKAKIRFQSFFMLMTIQPCCFASAMSASLNVPIFDAAP